jgi:hypothetical protein
MKSGSLNLLEPSGPVKACNGIALPFTHYIYWKILGIISCGLEIRVKSNKHALSLHVKVSCAVEIKDVISFSFFFTMAFRAMIAAGKVTL